MNPKYAEISPTGRKLKDAILLTPEERDQLLKAALEIPIYCHSLHLQLNEVEQHLSELRRTWSKLRDFADKCWRLLEDFHYDHLVETKGCIYDGPPGGLSMLDRVTEGSSVWPAKIKKPVQKVEPEVVL